MSSEFTILTIYGLFMMLTIVLQVLAAMGQVGMMQLFSSRDSMPRLDGLAGRLDRAQMNNVVAMALFAPAVLLLGEVSGSADTVLAAQIFLVARILYVVVYAAGISFVRTLVWSVGFLATGYLYLQSI